MQIEMLVVLAIFLLFAQTFAQDANCDFFQNVAVGTTFPIYSPNYPNSYQRGRTCRWIGRCPAGYLLRLDCYLELPLSTNCMADYVGVSRTGDPQLINAERYCGRQTLTGILSSSQQISVSLITSSTSSGGRFMCNMTTQALPPPACVCGVVRRNRIVGGTQAGVNEFTSAAGLLDKRTNRTQCGGVIISSRNVLTAAHCLDGFPVASISVSVGNADIRRGTMYNVQSYKKHEAYNPNTYDFDIALLFLVIQLTDNVLPVCLPFKYATADLTGAQVTIIGWGTIFFGGPVSNTLLKTDVTIIGQSQCRQALPTLTSQQFCANTTGRDACQFDSGGPALYYDFPVARHTLLGLSSYGMGCAAGPGAYTRVPVQLNWIINNTPGVDYCVVP